MTEVTDYGIKVFKGNDDLSIAVVQTENEESTGGETYTNYRS